MSSLTMLRRNYCFDHPKDLCRENVAFNDSNLILTWSDIPQPSIRNAIQNTGKGRAGDMRTYAIICPIEPDFKKWLGMRQTETDDANQEQEPVEYMRSLRLSDSKQREYLPSRTQFYPSKTCSWKRQGESPRGKCKYGRLIYGHTENSLTTAFMMKTSETTAKLAWNREKTYGARRSRMLTSGSRCRISGI